MIKSSLVDIPAGQWVKRRRVIDGWNGHKRLYVSKTNLKSYVVHSDIPFSLDNMVLIAGEYHFDTLKQLHEALNADYCESCNRIVSVVEAFDEDGRIKDCTDCGKPLLGG